MKLTFNSIPLNEVDVDNGRRARQLKDVYAALEKCLKNNQLKFKAEGDITNGFFILPADKHIVNVRFDLQEDGNLYIYVANCKKPKDSMDRVVGPFVYDNKKSIEKVEKKLPELIKAIAEETLVLSTNIDVPLTEGTINEANPFAAIGKGIANLAAKAKNGIDSFSSKIADSQEAKQAEKRRLDKLEGLTKTAADLLGAAAKGCSVSTKVNGSAVDVTVTANYLLGIQLVADPTNTKTSKVGKVLAVDGDISSLKGLSLADLIKALAKKLGLKDGVAEVLKVLGQELDDEDEAEDADETGDEGGEESGEETTSEDPKDTPKVKSLYQIDNVIKGLSTSSKLDRSEIMKLIGESTSLAGKTRLVEAGPLPMGSVKPENYMKVYDDVKANNEAVIALVKRFINRAWKVNEDEIEKTSSGIMKAYASKLVSCNFKPAYQKDVACFVISTYWAMLKKLPTQLTNALLDPQKSSTLKPYLIDELKNKNTPKTLVKLDSIFDGSTSIVYSAELNRKGYAQKIMEHWYAMQQESAKKTLEQFMSGQPNHGDFCVICDVSDADAAQITSIEAVKRVIFVKGGLKGTELKDITSLTTTIDNINKLSDSKIGAEAPKKQRTVKQLDAEELESEIDANEDGVDVEVFMNSIEKIVKGKKLKGSAQKDLQAAILKLLA